MNQYETNESTATDFCCDVTRLKEYIYELRQTVEEREKALKTNLCDSVEVLTLEYKAKLLRKKARQYARDLAQAL